MTDYGMEIKNVNSDVLVDSTYRNLSEDASGANALITNLNSGGTSVTWGTEMVIPTSPLIPVVVWKPSTSKFSTVLSYEKERINYEDTENYDGFIVTTEAVPGSTTYDYIDWVCCRENRTASDIAYGLLINNAKGAKVFDSGLSYLKIHSIIDGSLSLPSPSPSGSQFGPYTDITHSSIENPYYFLTTNANYYYRTTSVDPEYWCYISHWTIGLRKLSSTSVRMGWYSYKNALDTTTMCSSKTSYATRYPKLIIASL